MASIARKPFKAIKNFFRDIDSIWRRSSVELIEWELREMENILGLILFGFMVGFPSAPMHITLDLLPHMGNELEIILDRIDTAHDPTAELFSLLDIG